LRAQDIHAAETVRFWSARVRRNDPLNGLADDAEAIAQAMATWPERKEPD
jgi:hypothetical protein